MYGTTMNGSKVFAINGHEGDVTLDFWTPGLYRYPQNWDENISKSYNPANLTMALLFFGDKFRSRNAKNTHDTSFES